MGSKSAKPLFERAVIFHLNEDASKVVRHVLKGKKIDVWEEKNLRELKYTLKTFSPNYLFINSDYIIKRGAGAISSFKKGTNGLSIIIVSTLDDREGILPFLDEGVSGVIFEPYHPKEIAHTITQAGRTGRAEIQGIALEELLGDFANPHKVFIGKSPNATQVRKLVQNAKKEGGPVLIIGEAGTGKTQISFSIHFNPQMGLTPIRVYDPIFESKRGRGLIKHIEGLGHSDTLIIKNTQNLNSSEIQKLTWMLKESNEKGGNLPRFLLHHNPIGGAPHRFQGLTFIRTIKIDPLRERKEDIKPIINYFQNALTRLVNVPKVNITPQAGKLLRNYRWPYNVTELMGVILYGTITTGGGEIYPFNLPDFITSIDPFAMEKMSLENVFVSKLTPIIKRMDRQKMEGLYSIVLCRMEIPLIKLVLNSVGGNQLKTARILGINRNTLMKKIKQYKISINDIDMKK